MGYVALENLIDLIFINNILEINYSATLDRLD